VFWWTQGLDEKGVKSIMWQILNGIAFLHQNWSRPLAARRPPALFS